MLRQCRPLLTASHRAYWSPHHPTTLARHDTSSRLPTRTFSLSSFLSNEQRQSKSPTTLPPKPAYVGPLAKTFRRLKIFSISSFSLSCTLAPFMFIIESNLPFSARIALASIALGTSGLSTALVGWCGKPYVTSLRYLKPDENGGAEGIEMTTQTLALKPLITRVYDPTFLIETKRGFAKWELAQTLVVPKENASQSGTEETVAETSDSNGTIVGRWVVKWSENGEGACHEVGKMIRYYNVHEELL